MNESECQFSIYSARAFPSELRGDKSGPKRRKSEPEPGVVNGTRYKLVERQCLAECPSQLRDDPRDPHACRECRGDCHQQCPNEIISSIEVAERFRGCTRVDGDLVIQFRSVTQPGISTLVLYMYCTMYIPLQPVMLLSCSSLAFSMSERWLHYSADCSILYNSLHFTVVVHNYTYCISYTVRTNQVICRI